MNLLTKSSPVKKIQEVTQKMENVKLLSKLQQAQTKGGLCVCNEKRIKRRNN